jgi:Glycosyl transferase 4-like domain
MRIIMTHGYMLSGTGSNIYVQSLCRALVGAGHDVHLICQEPDPLAYDFVGMSARVGAQGVEDLGEQETPYSGHCTLYRPEIGDLLPVYVYDDYPGWRVKTFLDLTQEELDYYLGRNVEALKTVLGISGAEAVITNHSVPLPLIARRSLEGGDLPYVSIVHGSCLQYVSRKSEMYMGLTREGLEDAREILALSSHSAGTIAEDFPDLADRTHSLAGSTPTSSTPMRSTAGSSTISKAGRAVARHNGHLYEKPWRVRATRESWPVRCALSRPPTMRARTTRTPEGGCGIFSTARGRSWSTSES